MNDARGSGEVASGERVPARRRARASGQATRVLVGALVAINVLLPLDLGFPAIPVLGRPLNPGIAATLVVFFVLAIQSRFAILLHLREPYCFLQSAYCCVLVVSALRSPSPPSALHATLLYCCTFLLNYMVLRYVTRFHGIRWLSPVVATLGVAAAVVGIAQGLLGLRLPMYDAWFENYFSKPAEDYMLATVRVAGTMNNPILYAILMVLVVPYVLDLRHWSSRVLAILTVLLAAGLSGSRTALVGLAFAVGGLAVYRRRALRAVPAVCLAGVLAVVALGGLAAPDDASRVGFLLERAGLKAESNANASAAALGISLRWDVLVEGLREMSEEWGTLTWLFGRGYFSSASVGQKFYSWYSAVDNVYLSVLYERGLLGWLLFVGAFTVFLIQSRRASRLTVHWYAPLAMALSGFSFSWDAYSTFNILMVASMACAMWHAEQARLRSSPRRGRLHPELEESR